jgi:hypothetical protein
MKCRKMYIFHAILLYAGSINIYLKTEKFGHSYGHTNILFREDNLLS